MYYKSETFPGKREWNVNLIGELEKICKCVHSATNISAEILCALEFRYKNLQHCINRRRDFYIFR